jgi:hypothetical protein
LIQPHIAEGTPVRAATAQIRLVPVLEGLLFGVLTLEPSSQMMALYIHRKHDNGEVTPVV